MRGRTNVGSGGIALNAVEVNKVIAPNENIVAGDFVQYNTHEALLDLPYDLNNSIGVDIKKIDNTHYLAYTSKYLFLIKKNGSLFTLIQTVNIQNTLYSICVDTVDSTIIYVLTFRSSPSKMLIETYKYENEDISLIETSECESTTYSQEGKIFCLGTIGENDSVLLTIGSHTSSSRYYADFRLYKRTTNSSNDFSYTLWKKTEILVTNSSPATFVPNKYDSNIGIVKDQNDFYITGVCSYSSSNYFQCIAKFNIDSTTGEVIIILSKSRGSYNYYCGVPNILNDKIIWTVSNSNSVNTNSIDLLISRKDTLETSLLVTVPNAHTFLPSVLFDTNKIIIYNKIFIIDSNNYQVEQIYSGDSSDRFVNTMSVMTNDGYILTNAEVASVYDKIAVLQLSNNNSEYHQIVDINYVKKWSVEGASTGQPVGVAKDSGIAGDTIGVFVPV